MQINCVLFADKIEYIYIAKKKKKSMTVCTNP